MSAAAERYAQECPHPQVKRGVRTLLEAIARLVPDGEAATPLIGMETLAAEARLNRRTVLRLMTILIEIGEVKVIDGGQGRIARYEIVYVDGIRPLTAPALPLRADLQAVRPRPAGLASDTLDLFDPPVSYDQKAINLRQTITSWAAVLVTFCRKYVFHLRQTITSWRSDGDQLATNDHKSPSQLVTKRPPTTTNYVLRRKKDPERTYESGGGDARARDGTDVGPEVERFLAWWTASYPAHNGGAVHLVDRARDGCIVHELLAQGRTVEQLQALALVLWAVTPDGKDSSDRTWIAASDRSIRVLRRKVNILETWRAQQSPTADKDWDALREEAERRLGRGWRKSG